MLRKTLQETSSNPAQFLSVNQHIERAGYLLGNPGTLMSAYRTHGKPATAKINIKRVPTTGIETVTINGDVYTYGIEFTGTTTSDIAQQLADVINGVWITDRNQPITDKLSQPIKDYWALAYNNTVQLIACTPGAGGNALTLATSTTATFGLSAATFTGGAGSTAGVAASVGSSTGLKTSQTSLAANTSRLWWGIVNCNTAALNVRMASGASASAFDFPLKACSAADDGTGGAIFDDTYQGLVTVYSGGTYRYTLIEMLRA